MRITPEQIRKDVYKAFDDAQEHKRNTPAQLAFEIGVEIDLEAIIYELITLTYIPLQAFCFITFDPVQREVYASQFRDRVVQHLLFNYLAPLFETLFIFDTYSCRIGKGTHFGVERFWHHLRSASNNFHEDAEILFLDLSGYFMSIDKKLVLDIVMNTIYKHLYRRSPDGRLWNERIDPVFCEYLLHCFLDRNPAKDRIIVGDERDWEGLPNKKRLDKSPEGRGIVIGDILSQLLSNVLLNETDQWAKRKIKLKHWGHYVDDHYAIHKSEVYLHQLEPVICDAFQELIHVEVNPNKIRYAPAKSANQFLGAYIGPYYLMPRTRTIRKFTRVAEEMEMDLIFNQQTPLTLEMIRARINSYCGIMSHYKAKNLLEEYLRRPAFEYYFDFDINMSKGSIKPEYLLGIPIKK